MSDIMNREEQKEKTNRKVRELIEVLKNKTDKEIEELFEIEKNKLIARGAIGLGISLGYGKNVPMRDYLREMLVYMSCMNREDTYTYSMKEMEEMEEMEEIGI
jgi:hypothetical protein